MEVHCHNLHVKINSFRGNQNDILLVINTLDAKKAHGWDNILIKMIQICGGPIALPLMLVKNFQTIGKKVNKVLVHKKDETNLLKNYRLISLLPIFSKVFERIIVNSLFNHSIGNKLFTSLRSCFFSRRFVCS